ncbi:hypothetical protein CU048_03405 [Beijerinckiaceae bacterium]|nr:hypothetical protein CU048_03405 [Beijerinckiaceae bacterium]
MILGWHRSHDNPALPDRRAVLGPGGTYFLKILKARADILALQPLTTVLNGTAVAQIFDP